MNSELDEVQQNLFASKTKSLIQGVDKVVDDDNQQVQRNDLERMAGCVNIPPIELEV